MIAQRYPAGPERDRRRSVAFGRLSQNVLLWKIPKQLSNSAFLFCVREDQNALGRNEFVETRQSSFQQGFVRGETEQLFGARPSAQRPKTFATAAGEDKCVHRIRHVSAGAVASQK